MKLIYHDPNGHDETRLIPQKQVSVKLNHFNKMRKFHNQLKIAPKIWLSHVQTSKVIQLIQNKTQLSNDLVSRIEQDHNYGERRFAEMTSTLQNQIWTSRTSKIDLFVNGYII